MKRAMLLLLPLLVLFCAANLWGASGGPAMLDAATKKLFQNQHPSSVETLYSTNNILLTGTRYDTATGTGTASTTATGTQTATAVVDMTITWTGTATRTQLITTTESTTETGTFLVFHPGAGTMTATFARTLTVTALGTGTATATGTNTGTGTVSGTLSGTVATTGTGSGTATGYGYAVTTWYGTDTYTATGTVTVTRTFTDTQTTTWASGGSASATLTGTATVTGSLSGTWTNNTTSTYSGTSARVSDNPTIDGVLLIPWTAASASSTSSSTVVNGADPRLTDARASTDTLYAAAPAYLTTGTATATSSSAEIAKGAKVGINTGTATNQVVMGNDPRLTDARTPLTHTHTVTDVSGASASTHTHAGTLITQWVDTPAGGASIATGTAWTTINSASFSNTGSQLVIDADAQYAINAADQECLLAIFVGGTQYGVYGYAGGPKLGSSYSIKSAHTRALVNTTATSVSVAVSGKVGLGAGACTVPSGANTVQIHYQMFR